MASQSPHLWKKADDGKTVELDSAVSDGLIVPKITGASGAAIDEFSTDGTLAGNSDTACPTEKAVRTYVDTTSTGIKWKQSVRVATVSNGTLATAFANGQTIDGKTLATGDRILIKDQSDQTANGIYTVNATGAPTRADDASTGAEILGCVVPVLEGDTNEDSAWCNTNSTAITLTSSNITFAIFGGIKAGNGLAFTADVLAIDTTITADLATGQTFTNKVIDGDDNTLSDIAYSSIKSTSRTGADAKLVTGTAGTSGNISQWNADGDLVDGSSSDSDVASAVSLKHTQHTDTGTTATTFTIDSDSTTGKIAITAVQNSGQNRTMTIQNQAMTADVTITLPNATGTLATLAGSEALTSKNINSNGAALGSGTGTPIFRYGDADTAVSYLGTATFVPFQLNVSGGGTGVGTLGAGYVRAATGVAQTGQLATWMVRTAITHNVLDAYGLQSHMTLEGSIGTTNANAHLTAISGKVTFDTTTVTKGWVTAGLFIIEGAGTCSEMCHGVSIVNEAGSTGAQSMLHLNDDVGTLPYFSFAGADGDGKGIYTSVPQTLAGSIMVLINGTPKFVPFYDGQHA